MLQFDSTSISVEYDGGESETLCTSKVLRDGILSLGWVKTRACSETPTDPCSDAGEDFCSHECRVSTAHDIEHGSELYACVGDCCVSTVHRPSNEAHAPCTCLL